MRPRPISAWSCNQAQRDWSNTLKRIAQCNAVFSVDTAVAHLSAGSERPTTLLLGDPPDWRWRPVPEDPQAPLWYPHLSVDIKPSSQRFTPDPHQQRNFQSSAMADAVLPETVFTPAISMISGENNGGVPKASSKGANKASTYSKQARCRRHRCVAARGWAAGKAHRDCRHGPTEHRHASRARESPQHLETAATADQAAESLRCSSIQASCSASCQVLPG